MHLGEHRNTKKERSPSRKAHHKTHALIGLLRIPAGSKSRRSSYTTRKKVGMLEKISGYGAPTLCSKTACIGRPHFVHLFPKLGASRMVGRQVSSTSSSQSSSPSGTRSPSPPASPRMLSTESVEREQEQLPVTRFDALEIMNDEYLESTIVANLLTAIRERVASIYSKDHANIREADLAKVSFNSLESSFDIFR